VQSTSDLRDAYLAVVEEVLLGQFAPAEDYLVPINPASRKNKLLARLLARRGVMMGELRRESRDDLERGEIWPLHALTMIGRRRLQNIRVCIESALNDNVPGDVIETGVWRGGASIYARAVLKAWDVADRCVWVADSFQGLPPRDLASYPADSKTTSLDKCEELAISLEQVQANFERLHLRDDQVRFVEGWFKDTLPALSGERWAVIRLDGDYYESTIQSLNSLYPNLSLGGWIIIDDYHAIDACRKAVGDYRYEHGIAAEIMGIDDSAVMWQRD
jgi:O-methyltransferase